MVNVRDIRTSCLEKHLDYACSLDAMLELDISRTVANAESHRVTLLETAPAEVFHVRELQRVTAADGKAHDAPLGTASGHAQQLIFTGDRSATLEGRMTLETAQGGVRIDVLYRGMLQLSAPGSAVFAEDRCNASLDGRAYLQTKFETLHPKYHWLTERVCVAFGTWVAEPRDSRAIRRVVQRYDLFSTG
jgi:hypothetical protein